MKGIFGFDTICYFFENILLHICPTQTMWWLTLKKNFIFKLFDLQQLQER